MQIAMLDRHHPPLHRCQLVVRSPRNMVAKVSVRPRFVLLPATLAALASVQRPIARPGFGILKPFLRSSASTSTSVLAPARRRSAPPGTVTWDHKFPAMPVHHRAHLRRQLQSWVTIMHAPRLDGKQQVTIARLLPVIGNTSKSTAGSRAAGCCAGELFEHAMPAQQRRHFPAQHIELT